MESDNSVFTREFFDDASKEWLKNKRKKRSVYKYTCELTFQSGKRCGRDCFKDNPFCQQHWALHQNELRKATTNQSNVN